MTTEKVALVTGANGFVGSNLCERLLATGRYRVKALMRSSSSTKNLDGINVEITHGEITNFDSLKEPFADVDVVFHVAGTVRERKKGDFDRVNRQGSENVARACAEREGTTPRLVLVSSQAAVGPSKTRDEPTTEAHDPSPVSGYGRSKLAGEDAVRAFSDRVKTSIVRPPTVYGPRDTDFYDVFKMAVRGFILKPGFSEKMYSIIHAHDLADALIEVSETGQALDTEDRSRGVYFATDGGYYSWEKICELTGEAVDKRPTVIPLPSQVTYVAAFFSELAGKITRQPPILNFDKVNEFLPDVWLCSSEKLTSDTGFSAKIPLKEGLKQTAGWYRDQGLLPG